MSNRCKGCDARDREIEYLRRQADGLIERLLHSTGETLFSQTYQPKDDSVDPIEGAVPVASMMAAFRAVHDAPTFGVIEYEKNADETPEGS